MQIDQCIRTRRSVRKYLNKAITREDLAHVVQLASFAPSWKNTQTTSYIGILTPELKNRIGEECMMGFAFNMRTATEAPAIVVVTTRKERSGYERDGSFTTSKGTHWQSFDAGIATQTFCLAAHSMGLATVIMGIFDEAKVAEVLEIPKTHTVSALIAIGYGNEEPKVPPRKPVEELLKIY